MHPSADAEIKTTHAPDEIEQVRRMVQSCIQCGTCGGSCPSGPDMDHSPRALFAMIFADMEKEVLRSNTPWYCVSCYYCMVRCPQDIKITDVMYVLKRFSIRQGLYEESSAKDAPGFSQTFIEYVENYGRSFELGLATRYHLAHHPLGMMKLAPMGLGMLSKGRMGLTPKAIKGLDSFKAMIKQGTQIPYLVLSDQNVSSTELVDAVLELEVRSLPTPNDPWGYLWLGTKGYAYTSGNNQVLIFQSNNGPATAGGQTGTAAFSTGLQQDRSNKPTITLTNEDVDPDPRWDEILKAGIDYHFQNFVDCVKSRKSSDLIADIEEGHISTAMMHLGNIAYRTGRKLVFDGKAENFGSDTEANSYLSRPGGGRKPYNMPDAV